MGLRVQVQHELGQCPVQPGDRPAHEGEARARQLGAGVEVQPQGGAQIDVILHREGVGAGRAPAAHLHVATLVGTHGHAVVRQVGHAHEHGGELGLQRLQPLGRGLELVADAGHLGHHGRGVFALGLELADLLAEAVAPGLQLLGAGLDGLALGFEGREALDVEEGLGVLAGLQPRGHAGQVTAQLLNVEHERLPKVEIV